MRELRPVRHVRSTLTEQGGMLLDLRGRGRWYVLTASGALWWRHLADGATPELATDRVADHYGVPPEHIRADMRRLADNLVKRNLLAMTGSGRWWRR